MWVYSNQLSHHGILGMKWGVRKEQEKAYRQKLTAIGKNKSVANTTDAKRFKYRNQSLGKRVAKTAATQVAQMLIGDIFNGNIQQYASMSKPELRKKLTQKAISLAVTTSANVVIKDALAKSASNRYTNKGTRVKGTKDKFMTKEDAIEIGVGAAVSAVPIAGVVLRKTMRQADTERRKNEAAFNRWGQNILPEKVDKFVWQSDDFKTAVIDNRR